MVIKRASEQAVSVSREAHLNQPQVAEVPNQRLCGAFEVHVQDNEFHSISESNVHQSANGITHSVRHGLSGVAQEAGERDDGNSIHGKDHAGAHVGHELDSDADRNKDEQDVQVAVEDDHLAGDEESLEAVGLVLVCFFGGSLGAGVST